jgi:hypothetical protein
MMSSRGHIVALVHAMNPSMGSIDLHDSPQLGTAALMVSSLRQSVVPVIAILALGAIIGCLTYFAVAPAPISQSATLAAHSAKEAPSTVGQGLTANAVIDRQRQLAEEIANAFQQAAVDRQAIEVREAAVVAAKPAFDGPIPLPRKRPSPRPPTDLSTSAVGWGTDDLR